jgi:hypothetical protein
MIKYYVRLAFKHIFFRRLIRPTQSNIHSACLRLLMIFFPHFLIIILACIDRRITMAAKKGAKKKIVCARIVMNA